MGRPASLLRGGQGEGVCPQIFCHRPAARLPREEGATMKSFPITAALFAAAAWPSFAKQVRIPITYVDNVPVPCGEDPLRTCHNLWHPDLPEPAAANPGDAVTCAPAYAVTQ